MAREGLRPRPVMSLKPPRLWGVPASLLMLARHYAGLGTPPGVLPDPETALRNPDGLRESAPI